MTETIEINNHGTQERVKFTGINCFLAESLYNAKPSLFGRHKIKEIYIRSIQDSRNKKIKIIIPLPDEFNGTINAHQKLSKVSEENGYYPREIAKITNINNNLNQFIVETEERTHHTERTKIILNGNNELLDNLKEWCQLNFPNSSIIIDSILTETEHNGQTYTTEWIRGKVVNGNNVMGLRLTKINTDAFQELELETLKDIVGEFTLQDGENIGDGLLEDLCKYEFQVSESWEKACHIL